MPVGKGSSRPLTLTMFSRPLLMESRDQPRLRATPAAPMALNTENRPGMGIFIREVMLR